MMMMGTVVVIEVAANKVPDVAWKHFILSQNSNTQPPTKAMENSLFNK